MGTNHESNRTGRVLPAVLATMAMLVMGQLSSGEALAQCQNICLYNNPGTIFCTSNADCTYNGTDYCINPGCCDQAEELLSNNLALPHGACACGDTIVGDVELKHDILCTSGNGLTVDSAAEDLNLNGHRIACDGSTGSCGTGVILTGGGATVKGSTTNKGGRIEGFNAGVVGTTGGGQEASQLTISDAGLPMQYGIDRVKFVRKNVITGAAAGYGGGRGIRVYDPNCRIEDNLITDSSIGILVDAAGGGAYCDLIHNRALGNDYGLVVYFGSFRPANSVDNVFLNNSVADYSDTVTTNRLNTDKNVCRLSGAGNACSLVGMDFIP